MKYKIKKIIYKMTNKKDKIMDINMEMYRSKGVKIGNNVRAFSPLISSEPYLLEFGNNITVSTQVTFITHDNSVSKIIDGYTDVFGKIKIGDNCFIGHNTTILPGVEIGNNTIIGAGSVVTKSFKQGNVIIGGNPAKILTTVDRYKEKIHPFCLNTLNLSFEEKKNLVLNNKDCMIVKENIFLR